MAAESPEPAQGGALLGRDFEENSLARDESWSILGPAEDEREQVEPGLAVWALLARDVGPWLDRDAVKGRAAQRRERLRAQPPSQNDHAAAGDREDALDLECDLSHWR